MFNNGFKTASLCNCIDRYNDFEDELIKKFYNKIAQFLFRA